MDARWTILLAEIRALHAARADLQEFHPLPDDLPARQVSAYHVPAADLMVATPGDTTPALQPLRDALVACAPLAQWRETYQGTDLAAEFRTKFACYEVLGVDAPFGCDTMRSFVVWMPPGMTYPWHHHPAEEIYVVLAGQAEFALHGEENRILGPGESIFHPSNRPHALFCHDTPVMTYVLWRGDLATRPVFTRPEELQ